MVTALAALLAPVSCDASDRNGQSSTDFAVRSGESYLIRVAQQPQSAPGTFTLTMDLATPPPGRRLPAAGVTGGVRRVFEPGNAWSAHLHAGVTYRVNLATRGCLSLAIYPPARQRRRRIVGVPRRAGRRRPRRGLSRPRAVRRRARRAASRPPAGSPAR